MAGDIVPMQALPLSDTTPPLPAPSSGEWNIISSAEAPGLLPGMSPVELVEEGSLGFVTCVVKVVAAVVVVGAAMEEAEVVEEEGEMMENLPLE